jgi:predicted P-loop ATPase
VAFNIKFCDEDDTLFQYLSATHRKAICNLEPFEDDSIQNQSFYIKQLNSTKGAIEKQGGDNHTFHVARDGKLRGLSKRATLALMLEYWNEKCQGPWTEAELTEKVNNAYEFSKAPQGCMNVWRAFQDVTAIQYDSELEKDEAGWSVLRAKKGKEDPTAETWNARAIFYSKEVEVKQDSRTVKVENPVYRLLKYNQFALKISFANQAPWHKRFQESWTDLDVSEARRWMDQKLGMAFSKTVMEDAALQVAMTYKYHPVREWLSSLRWDGEARLDRMLIDYAGSPDTPYVREVSKNTIIAAVARVYQPGCQHDSMLVLEGAQGTGKTSFVRILGNKYYADIKIDLLGLKDTIQGMQGNWILEASELEFLKRGEAQAIKRFLTLTHDVVRMPYNRYTEEYPRQSIFIGTVNPDNGEGYLSDTEGNRRYWPIPTTAIDLPGLERDRDQLFAEAYHRYKEGEKWHIKDLKLIKMANEEAALRVGRDPWEETLAHWLSQEHLMPLTGQYIASGALSLKGREYDKIAKNRIGKCLKKLGYEYKNKRHEKSVIKVWVKEDQEDYLEGL